MITDRNPDVSFAGIETVISIIIGIAGIILIISAFRFISTLDFLGRILIGGFCAGFCFWHMKNVFKGR